MSKAIICFSTDNGAGAQTKIQQVDDTHGLPISGSISAVSSAVATAVAPTLVEGSTNAFSSDLNGALRIGGTISASSSMRATAAAPSYVEGTDNALSSNLAGDLRTISKLAAGTALVGKFGIDQTTPGTTNLVAASNLPTAVDVNSGVKSNSTLRVVLATDQPALTNKLLVTPDSVALPANQSVNVSQINGVTTLMGNGATGTGSQRCTLASDNSAVALWGHGATGASVPANATYMGGRTLAATPSDTTAQMNAPVLDLKGSLAVQPYGLSDNCISGLTAAMTGTTSTAVTGMGAPGANLFNYITTIVVGNSHATVGTFVEFQDGSGGTTFFTVPAPAVYGGAVITLPKPLKQPTANTALYCKDTTTGANVIVSVAGFKGP